MDMPILWALSEVIRVRLVLDFAHIRLLLFSLLFLLDIRD
jgi:hypothetical protein